MKHLLFVGSFLVFSLYGFSQQKDTLSVSSINNVDSINLSTSVSNARQKKDEKTKKHKKNEKVAIEALQNELSQVRDELNIYRQKDSTISARLDSVNFQLATIAKQRKKLENDSIEIHSQKEQLQNRKDAYDRMIARFCYIRLSQRYNKKWVDEALEMWGEITTPSVLKEYKNTDVLLKRYVTYYTEIRDIITDAQTDEKGRKFNDVASDYAMRHIEKLHNTEYYRTCFNKDFKIPYLDQQIMLFEKILKETSPGKYDFQIVLSYGFPLSK